MATKVRLQIDVDAHLEGIKQTQQALESLGASGKNLNQALKTTSLDQMKLALERSYHSNAMFNGELKASNTYLTELNRAWKTVQTSMGKGQAFTFTDASGATQSTNDLKVAWGVFQDLSAKIQAEAELVQNRMSGMFGGALNMSGFQSNMEKNAQVTSIFGSQLDVVRQKMSTLQQEIEGQTLLGGKEADIEQLKRQWVSLAEEEQKILKSFDGDEFFGDLDKQANGARMFGTQLDAINLKMQAIKSAGMRLVDIGGDPEEIKRLSQEYQKLTLEHERLSKAANGTGTRIKNLIKNFVSAQLIVWAIRKTIQLFTQGLQESSKAAAEAEQVQQKFLTVFDGYSKAQKSVEDLTNSFGLALSSSQNIMATIGDMAMGLGATKAEAAEFSDTTAKFIQDLIAFKDIGGDVIEVTQAFMSGAAGNTRNFRQWGSVVRDATVEARLHEKGLDDLTGEALEWAKVQERTAIVMEQQANAIGATEREWEMFLSVQRRNKEASKELKEIVGREYNEAIKPLAMWWLQVKENIIAADKAREKYRKGEYVPLPDAEVAGSATERNIVNAIRYDELTRFNIAIRLIEQAKRNLSSEYGVEDTAHVYGKTVEYEEILSLAKQHQVSLRTIAKLAQEQGKEVSDATWEEIRATDSLIDRQKKIKDAYQSAMEAAQTLSEKRADVAEQIQSRFFGLGASGYASRDAGEFSKMTIESITGGGTYEADVKNKLDALFDNYQHFNNMLLTETDILLQQNLQTIVNTLADAIDKVNDSVQLELFAKQKASINEQIAALDQRNTLLAEYGDDQAEIVDILMQQWEAEQDLNKLMDDAISKGLDMNTAERERARLAALTAEYYQRQVRALKEGKSTAEWLAERSGRIESVREKTAPLESENIRSQRMLSLAWNASPLDRAEVERTSSMEALQPIFEELAQGLIGEANMKVAEKKGITAVDYIELDKNGEFFKTFNAYRLAEETKIENEYLAAKKEIDDNQLISLKESYDNMQATLKDLWRGIGDVGMVQGWIDMFNTTKEYAMSKAGGFKSESEAIKMAGGDVALAVILEFASRLESVNELMGMISGFMDELAPIVDQFLAPLLMIARPLISLLVDLLIPILEFLFPIIKGVALVLLPLIATVDTVVTTFRLVGETLEVFVWNISHWLNPKEYPNWGEEIGGIWEETWDKMEEIANLELDVRKQYVKDLTDAQKGELDAYNEMFRSGLLTLTEYNAMVGKNVYGRNFDAVDIASFASGGDFITNGEQIIRVGEAGRERVQITPLSSSNSFSHGYSVNNNSFTVVVNGANADPEEIALAVRREFNRMERRGVKYA